MRLLELTLPDAVENVALDEALLRQVEETDGQPVLRLWELESYAVIVGRANRIERNVNVEACRRDGVPIVRRFSGGGTVLLGPGALVFSLFLRVEKDRHLANIDAATAIVLDRVLTPLKGLVASLERKGTSDLASEGVKVSGNSQRWLRSTFLHHGTLLYDFDVSLIERYLSDPEREPDYRQGREHADFVRNLPISRDELRKSLTEAWDARLDPPELPFDLVRDLVRDRYRNDEWTFRM
ncbi:MAG: lipoate--protein ligase family protein [Planctomycetaceae bacterium]|nr:lipoate--protein ligase family protein [Planctomycetaceae bacterium]